MPHRLLLVDDEPFNLELLSEHLSSCGYDTVSVESGDAAWQCLSEQGETFSAILLDKMMPGMDGFELLRRIKATPALEFLPVIMQTAMGTATSVQQGLAAGAFYYLTKPFSRDMLLAVVAAAVSHWDRHSRFKELATQQLDALPHLQQAQFSLRHHKEAQSVSALLARTCPQPERVATGLFELLVNAIEHGNLSINYAEKSTLQQHGIWEAELEQRLSLPYYQTRRVEVTFERTATHIRFTIRDMGEGFDWSSYQHADHATLLSRHGRGILIARKLSFDTLEYRGCGNEVVAQVQL